MSDVPPELLDANTPPDVVLTNVAAPSVSSPTLDVPLGEAVAGAPAAEAATHRLVTIGDSLTHGVSSGAVYFTKLSWPAQVAGALGLSDFAAPTYGGPLDGLPFNIESLVRQIGEAYGDDIGLLERLSAPFVVHGLVDDNEDYWEHGVGAEPPPVDVRFHNLGIYGWDVRDALSFTSVRAATAAGKPQRDDLFGIKPGADNDIAAHSVLAPFGGAATQVGAAEWFGANGGIDTLIVALGANNALDSVVSKQVVWSAEGFDDVDVKGRFNVWRPTHFAKEYSELVTRLKSIAARRVVLATVPHVTIAPIAHGVNPADPGQKWREGSRYFPYYTDPWIDEDAFRPSKHRHLTHQQARAIDSAIDQYNATITDAVRRARGEGRDWLVLDLCGLLDSLASRRFVDDETARDRNDVPRYELPEPIAELDTRRFRSDKAGRSQGGLFSLDTIHPTISAYGVVAQAVIDVLAAAGVAADPIDFAEVLASDTLNSDPPALVDDVFGLIAPFAKRFVSRI